jgi:NhaA family Na+:H+ antiporter
MEIGVSFLHKSFLHWINDGLMVIFFLLVGLEIKRELAEGELSSVKQAVLPAFAAIGGMVVPAVIYISINAGSPETQGGWAIPTATDIAFSLGVLSLLGKRVPISLKIFLTALAIIDDLGAILIIALFYTASLDLTMLLAAAGVFAVMVAFNRFGLKNLAFYLFPALFLWYFVLKSGIHPTIAGVLTAFVIPLESGKDFEHRLFRPVNYLILPLFALANTAIPLSVGNLSGLFTPLALGVILGLFVGKPLGIVFFSYLPSWFRIAERPDGIGFKQIAGLGFTAGIGFTMSIFIASLSFPENEMLNLSKLAIIIGSVLAALTGLIILSTSPKSQEE